MGSFHSISCCILIEGKSKCCHRTALKTQSTASNHIKSSPETLSPKCWHGRSGSQGPGKTYNAYAMWCSDVAGIENKRMQSICQRLLLRSVGFGSGIGVGVGRTAWPSVHQPVRPSPRSSVHSFIHSFACHHTRMPAIYVSSGSGLFCRLHSRNNDTGTTTTNSNIIATTTTLLVNKFKSA